MLILLTLVASATANQMEPFIVGGQGANIKDWPFIAFVEVSQKVGPQIEACGGSLLSSQTVLTAAHCLDDPTNKKTLMWATTFTIFMGHNRFDEATMSRKGIDYETHKDYSPTDEEVRYDIGVLFLAAPVKFSENIKKTVLQRSFNNKKDRHLAVAGWGSTDPDDENAQLSYKLKSLKLRSTGGENCQHLHKVICTAMDDNQYAYSGDSGGPMVNAKTRQQLGIVSFRDVTTGMTVFSSIPKYWKWIERTQLDLFRRYCGK